MKDPVRSKFLAAQLESGLALASTSAGILELVPAGFGPNGPDRYFARFHARGLVRTTAGEIREHDDLVVGIRFPEDYLYSIRPPEIVSVCAPHGECEPFHPNIHPELPIICPGHLPPGLPIERILWQTYEIWTWNRCNFASVLNPDAAEWGRNHPDRYPVDRRPLARGANTEGTTAS